RGIRRLLPGPGRWAQARRDGLVRDRGRAAARLRRRGAPRRGWARLAGVRRTLPRAPGRVGRGGRFGSLRRPAVHRRRDPLRRQAGEPRDEVQRRRPDRGPHPSDPDAPLTEERRRRAETPPGEKQSDSAHRRGRRCRKVADLRPRRRVATRHPGRRRQRL
ncbi:MAG: Prolyl-tRNA synthetase, bacterial type, partial [uncultured Rubrobacteraceae bacterium]